MLESGNLIRQIIDWSLGEDNLLAHDVYLYFKSLVVADSVVKSHLLVLNSFVKTVELNFLVVLVFLWGDFRFNIAVDFIQLGVMLFAYVLKNKLLFAFMF